MDSDNNSEIEDELKKLGYWNNIYSKQNYFGTGPTILALEAQKLIKTNSIRNILELGCGQGRDSLFFAINFIKKTKNEQNIGNLELYIHDTLNPFNFKKPNFELVYSNLALQFFDLIQLPQIFSNIKKIMEPNSFFLFSTKKSGDKYFEFGNKISENSFEYNGITRFFFKKTELENILKKYFTIISFENDSHINTDETESVWWKILVKN